METIIVRKWREDFALAASLKREEILNRERMAQFAAHQRMLTIEKKIEEKRREQEFAAMEAVFVSPQRIAQYHVQLDRYDAKTVEFLMGNGEALARKRELIRGILDQAHQLPDGRRVFKTEDGQRVFDEHGQQLGADVIAPEMIDDRKVRWEILKGERQAERKMADDQEAALSLQTKLDDARVRLKRGDITEADLTKIEADLAATAPDALREQLGLEKPKAAQPEPASRAPELPSNMDSLMRQTGLGSTGPMPG